MVVLSISSLFAALMVLAIIAIATEDCCQCDDVGMTAFAWLMVALIGGLPLCGWGFLLARRPGAALLLGALGSPPMVLLLLALAAEFSRVAGGA